MAETVPLELALVETILRLSSDIRQVASQVRPASAKNLAERVASNDELLRVVLPHLLRKPTTPVDERPEIQLKRCKLEIQLNRLESLYNDICVFLEKLKRKGEIGLIFKGNAERIRDFQRALDSAMADLTLTITFLYPECQQKGDTSDDDGEESELHSGKSSIDEDFTSGVWYQKAMETEELNPGPKRAREVAAALLNPQCPLIRLKLVYNFIGDDGAKVIADALRVNTCLQSLDLYDNNVGDEGAKALAEALGDNNSLRSLDLSSNKIGDEGGRSLVALSANTCLQSLNLNENEISDGGAKALADALRGKSTCLRVLKLESNKVGDQGGKALADALHHNNRLRSLTLSFNSIGREGAMALAKALLNNTCLQSLNLFLNKIGNDGAKALADALHDNKFLQSLDLSFNSIGREGAKAVADALCINTCLISLSLSHNKIDDGGADALADALRRNTCLQTLDLGYNNFSDVGAKVLIEALRVNAALEYQFELSGDSISNVVVDEAKKLLWNIALRKKGRAEYERIERLLAQQPQELNIEGSLIMSQDELYVVLDQIQHRIEELDDVFTAEAIDKTEELQLLVESLSEYKECQTVLPAITTLEKQLDESQSNSDRLTMISEIKRLRNERFFSKARELALKLDKEERERTQVVKSKQEQLNVARKALEARKSMHTSTCVTVSNSRLQEYQTALVKALEATNVYPPKNVPLAYLATITRNWQDRIGRGAQGSVYRAFDQSIDTTFAVKHVSLANSSFQKEVAALSKLVHPNIVRLIGHCTDLKGNSGFLVYEYAAGGTLLDILCDEADERKQYPWQHRLDTFAQIIQAVQHCHKNGVKHRDIKPENVCFVDNDYLTSVLIDFGISTDIEGTLSTWGGTLPYMAPEYKNRKEGDKVYFTEKTEVYSLGVLLIAIVTAITSSTDIEKAKKLVKDNSGLSSLVDRSAGSWRELVMAKLQDLVSKCIQPMPAARPSLDTILELLQDIRKDSRVELTARQSHALMTATEFSSATPSVVVKLDQCSKQCSSCSTLSCISCPRGHNFCSSCLEACVKHQIWSDGIRCNVGGCVHEFEVADLKDLVSNEHLANFALAQEQRFRRAIKENRLESLLRDVQSKVTGHLDKAVAFLVSRKSECPAFCILWPVQSKRFSSLRFTKEYRLYFLCACDLTPIQFFISVKQVRKWVKKVAPVLKATFWVLTLLSRLSSFPLPIPIPGVSNEDKLKNLMESMTDLMDSNEYQGMIDKIEKFREDGLNEENLRELLCQQASEVNAHAQAEILQLDQTKGWSDEMVAAPNYGGEWGWVKRSNLELWQTNPKQR